MRVFLCEQNASPMSSPDRRILSLLGAAASAAAVAVVVVVGWLWIQAVKHPETQARQFGKYGDAVPLWIPLILFIALSLGVIVYIFVQAYLRTRRGEDLFKDQKGRKRPE